jgi:hypothetical protein
MTNELGAVQLEEWRRFSSLSDWIEGAEFLEQKALEFEGNERQIILDLATTRRNVANA